VQRRIVRVAVELEAQLLAYVRHFDVLREDVTGNPPDLFLPGDLQQASQQFGAQAFAP
jgi:hypothetical protein